MARLLGVMALVAGGAFAVRAPAEDMASPGHPGWQAAEGSGCLVWNEAPQAGSKVTWSGPCESNRTSGQGELVWRYAGKTARYVGEMRDGKQQGRGTYVWANGDRYEGDFVDGKETGRGTKVWASGDSYEGDFVDDKKSDAVPTYGRTVIATRGIGSTTN